MERPQRTEGTQAIAVRAVAWTWAGLVLALFGPGLVAWASQGPGHAPETLGRQADWLGLFVALVATVAAIARLKEGLGPRDVGFRRSGALSLALAVPLALFFIFVFGPLAYAVLATLGIGGFEAGLAQLRQLPPWYLALAIVLVAAGEEWLYRGYAIERLQALTGSPLAAGGLSLAAFALAHLPVWGPGPALTTVVSGGILTLLYLWRRDVLMLIAAHVATDLYGLLGAASGG